MNLRTGRKTYRRTTFTVVAFLLLAGISTVAYGLDMRSYTSESRKMYGGVRDLVVFGGELYIGSIAKGVFSFDPVRSRFTPFTGNDEIPSKEIVSLAVLGENLYIGTRDGLAVFDGNIVKTIRKVENVTMKTTVLGADIDGNSIYASSVYLSGGLVRNDSSGWKFLGGEGKGLFNDVNSFAFFGGKAYFGSISGALYVYDGTSIEKATDQFLAAKFSSLGVLDGTVYVGTNRGLYRLEGRECRKVKLPGEFDAASILKIVDHEGSLIVASTVGILKFSPGEVKTLTEREGLPGRIVYTVAVFTGNIYAGTRNGLVEIKGW